MSLRHYTSGFTNGNQNIKQKIKIDKSIQENDVDIFISIGNIFNLTSADRTVAIRRYNGTSIYSGTVPKNTLFPKVSIPFSELNGILNVEIK